MSVNETYKGDASTKGGASQGDASPVDLLMAVAVMDCEMKKLRNLLAAARAMEESSINLLMAVAAILAASRKDEDEDEVNDAYPRSG